MKSLGRGPRVAVQTFAVVLGFAAGGAVFAQAARAPADTTICRGADGLTRLERTAAKPPEAMLAGRPRSSTGSIDALRVPAGPVLGEAALAAGAQPSPAAPPACLGLDVAPSPADVGGAKARSVLGGELAACGSAPLTGFRRNGRCDTGPDDAGVHVVCAQLTRAFLDFSKSRGNDLITPLPAFGFPGLLPGQRWCLCAERYREALDAGSAPPVDLRATHARALDFLSRAQLEAHAIGR